MIPAGLLIVGATYLFGSWLAGVSMAALLLIWILFRGVAGPAVIPIALTFQWIQVTAGMWYHGLTGEVLPAIQQGNWERMLLLGLGCIVALAVGLRAGMVILHRAHGGGEPQVEREAFGWQTLLVVYFGSIASAGAIQEFAWQHAGLTQAILALSFSRLAVLYLMIRRLVAPEFRWPWIVVLVVVETGLGFTGFFAGFREPLIMAAIGTLEVFDRRNVRHWATAVGLAVVLTISSVVWMGVRTEYRRDFDSDDLGVSRAARLERMQVLAGAWLEQDTYERLQDASALVDRIWAIQYPALALDRVPALLPHTEGEIIGGALWHLVTPRLFFPDKPLLPSDSEMVRKYSGVWVAGVEQNTSIAFGYAAESYVDFGVPLMFLPSLVFGVAMGGLHYALMHVLRYRDVAVPLMTVIFWLALYLFERSWIKTLGMTLTMTLFLGGLGLVLDRYLAARDAEMDEFEPAPEPREDVEAFEEAGA